MTAENVTLNGGADVSGDLLMPGTPTVQLNGNPNYGGTLDGIGTSTPTNHKVTLNGGATLGHVVRRTDPVSLPVVAAPPQPAGTRSVSLNNPGESPGDFTTLKNLTLNSNVGLIAVPPGTYGSFNANSGSGFALGIAGATTPAVYNFQNLTLNSNSSFTVVGPVVVTVDGGFSTNANMGASDHPEWLKLRIAGGGLSIAGNRSVYAHLDAPDGTLTLNGGAQFTGLVASDRLTVNGNAVLRLVVPVTTNQPPVVALTAPADGAGFTAPASFTLTATATDPDGTVARVEFYSGATRLGEDASAPYEFAVSGLAAGSYTYFARAIDSQNASTDSALVSVTVSSPNEPPTVTLTAPVDGALYTAPVTLTLTATATDTDGSVAKVEFYQGSTKLGEDLAVPYELATGSLAPGTYIFTATAYDNLGSSTGSPATTVTVVAPNEAPAVSLVTPPNGAAYEAPAAFTLTASATDADGTVTKVEFFQNNILLGTVTSPPFEWPVTGLVAGSYNFLARATDNSGSATDSAAISITVSPPVDRSLPFLTGFEATEGYSLGSLHGQKGWTASSLDVVTNADFASGAQSVLVPGSNPPGSVSRSFDPHPGQTVVFVDLYALPFAATEDASSAQLFTLDAARVAFVRDGNAGRFSAYHATNSTWLRMSQTTPLDAEGFAADWVRLTLRLDYAAAEWDLYVQGSMAVAKLGFPSPPPVNLGALGLSGHSTAPTLLDDVLVAFENPLFVDADRDGIDDAWEIAHGLNPALNDRNMDRDGDGVANLQEFNTGTNPVDYYNGRAFALGTSSSSSGSTVIAYSYDASGRIVLADYAEGRQVHFAHSAASNLESASSSGIGTTIVEWRAAHGLPTDGTGDGADTAILADDGLPNLAKYAFGLIPQVAADGEYPSVDLVSTAGSDYLALTYTRPDPAPIDLVYRVEVSADGVAWSSGSGATVNVSTTDNGDTVTVVVRDATPTGQSILGRRIRLAIERRTL